MSEDDFVGHAIGQILVGRGTEGEKEDGSERKRAHGCREGRDRGCKLDEIDVWQKSAAATPQRAGCNSCHPSKND